MPTARSALAPPLPGCAPLFDAAAMRAADRDSAEEHGMPTVLLMERAGLAAAAAILARWPDRDAAAVLVGPGNNGGDGMVVARHLAEAGWRVRVLAPGARPPETADGRTMTAIVASLGLRIEPLDHARPPGDVLLIDALLGTGVRGAPRGPLEGAVRWAGDAGGPVVSLDVPSGVDADTGRVAGRAVRAALTVTFHGDMAGLRISPGREHAGEVVVADIGVPSAVRATPVAWLAGPAAARAVPRKAQGADKYGSGAVLVVAGSPGLTGAAVLCARATLRAGAGLTAVATPAPAQPAVAAQLVEVMTVPLPHDDGRLAPVSVDAVVAEAGRMSALAIGPGLGRAAATTPALAAILARVALPAVIDADGLWHLAQDPGALRGRPAASVITPHAGEAARLLGRSRAAVEGDRLASARALARAHGATVVLKGPGTLVAAPDGRVVVVGTGSAALATAGTGDVLTGVIAALLAKGMPAFDAAVAGAALHGHAGELTGHGDGTIAGEVADALPTALAAARA